MAKDLADAFIKMPGVSVCLVIRIVATSATEEFGLLNANVAVPVIVVVAPTMDVWPLVKFAV